VQISTTVAQDADRLRGVVLDKLADSVCRGNIDLLNVRQATDAIAVVWSSATLDSKYAPASSTFRSLMDQFEQLVKDISRTADSDVQGRA
jgi:hypothetical protein